MANELIVSFATASANLYVILRRISDKFVWTGSAMEAWADGHIANYAIAMTDSGGDQYVADMPSTLPTGYDWRAYYYERAGGTPAISDLLLLTSSAFHWDGVVSAAADPGTATWYYANQNDVEDALGALNLTVASQQENTTTITATGRVQRAGVWADAFMDSRLHQFGYTTPLAGMDTMTTNLMKGISVNLVAFHLNTWRAIQAGDQRAQRGVDKTLNDWNREARAQLTNIGLGLMNITANFQSGKPEAVESFAQFQTPFVNVPTVYWGFWGVPWWW